MEPLNIVTDVSPNEKLLGHLHTVICELLEDMNALWETIPKRPRVESIVTLSETPISLKLTRRYGFLFFGKPIDLLIDTCGIGRVCVPMNVGWNEVGCLPEGTTIALASDSSLRAVYRCIDTLE